MPTPQPGLDDRAGSVELATLFAFGGGELAEEVLIDLAEQVAVALTIGKFDRGDQVDQLTQFTRFELGPSETAVQFTPEVLVFGLDIGHRAVDDLADIGLLGLLAQLFPARPFGHPGDVVFEEVVAVFKFLSGDFGQVLLMK